VKSSRAGSITALAGAIIGALVLMCSRSSSVEAAYPVENAALVAKRAFLPRLVGFIRRGELGAENARLRRQVDELTLLRYDIDRLELENARLRRALDYASRAPEKWIAAGVLSSGGGAASVRDIVRVDKGSLEGIRKDAVVVVPDGLVGLVTAVTPHTSEVTLVTDLQLKVACEIETGSRPASGILSGGSESQLVLRHFGGGGPILPPARVFTSGRGGVFPRGLEVGTLQVLTNDVRGVKGEVLPRVDYSTLEDVFIRRAK